MNVYNELVGKPAGYAAITPGMPGIVRMAGGALAVPTLVDSTMQTYNQNIEMTTVRLLSAQQKGLL